MPLAETDSLRDSLLSTGSQCNMHIMHGIVFENLAIDGLYTWFKKYATWYAICGNIELASFTSRKMMRLFMAWQQWTTKSGLCFSSDAIVPMWLPSISGDRGGCLISFNYLPPMVVILHHITMARDHAAWILVLSYSGECRSLQAGLQGNGRNPGGTGGDGN